MKNKRKTAGFTLAELLIVVAIIGVLVAVSIPVFANQLEKSREATDLANVRSAYAKVRAAAIEGTSEDQDITETDTKYTISVRLKQKRSGWQTTSVSNIGGIVKTDNSHWKGEPYANGRCTVSCNKNNGDTVINWNGGEYLATPGVYDKIYKAFSDNKTSFKSNNIDSNAPDKRKDGSTTSTKIVSDALKGIGIDLSAMGVKTWHMDITNGGNSYEFYVTPVDITNVDKAKDVPVMKISISKNNDEVIASYSVDKKKVNTNNTLNDGTSYNYLDQNIGTFDPNNDYKHDYNLAVKELNAKLADSEFNSYSMDEMPK